MSATTTIPEQRGLFRRSAETEILRRILVENDEPAYAQMNSAINGDVQGPQRHHLTQARAIVLRENRRAFDCVENVGLTLLKTTEQIHEADTYYQRRIRRTAKLSWAVLSCADYESMTKDEQCVHTSKLAGLAVLQHVTARRTQTKLLGCAQRGVLSHQLDIGRTLAAIHAEAESNGNLVADEHP